MERIDKIIASQGQYSRKEVKALIAKRRIAVDGRIVSSSSEKADPMTMLLTVDGKPLEFKRNLYLVLNKPKGYVSATEDRDHQTVLELVPVLPAESPGLVLLAVSLELPAVSLELPAVSLVPLAE